MLRPFSLILPRVQISLLSFNHPRRWLSASMSPKGAKPRVIYWFRTDLRLHDSPAFKAALDLNPEAFYPIWTWDPHYVYRARVGPNRWQFLYASVFATALYCLLCNKPTDVATEQIASVISPPPLRSSIRSRSCTSSAKRPRPSFPSSSSYGKSRTSSSRKTQMHMPAIAMRTSQSSHEKLVLKW